jgi:hypothetical protein
VRALACVALALLAGACIAEDAPAARDVDSEMHWVALHVQDGQGQTEYFAQVSFADFARLRDGDGKRPFVLARHVCSIDDDGQLQEYADDDHGDEVWFRVEDIRRIVFLKRDPHAADRDKDDDADAKKPAEAPGPTLPKF